MLAGGEAWIEPASMAAEGSGQASSMVVRVGRVEQAASAALEDQLYGRVERTRIGAAHAAVADFADTLR